MANPLLLYGLCTTCSTTWYHNPGDQNISLHYLSIMQKVNFCVCVSIGPRMPQQLTADWRCLRVECHGGEDTQNLAQELRRVVINGGSNWG
jgi:hypothetical protein